MIPFNDENLLIKLQDGRFCLRIIKGEDEVKERVEESLLFMDEKEVQSERNV